MLYESGQPGISVHTYETARTRIQENNELVKVY